MAQAKAALSNGGSHRRIRMVLPHDDSCPDLRKPGGVHHQDHDDFQGLGNSTSLAQPKILSAPGQWIQRFSSACGAWGRRLFLALVLVSDAVGSTSLAGPVSPFAEERLSKGFVVEFEGLDPVRPSMVRARTFHDPRMVQVEFSEAMDPVSTTRPENYQLTGNAQICGATLLSSNVVQLETVLPQPGWYTLSARDIRQAAEPGLTVDPGHSVRFTLTDGWVNWGIHDRAGPGGSIDEVLQNPFVLAGPPDRQGFFTDFEFPTYEHGAELIGQLRAYLFPPVSGEYRFWIYADDTCLLFISTNDLPRDKRQIARLDAWTNFRDYQVVSEPVELEAGRRYYLEALYKEAGGGDGVGVAWQLPGGVAPSAGAPPISGEFLSSFTTPGPVDFQRRPPATLTVESGQPVEFRVGESDLLGTPPYQYEWSRVWGNRETLLSTNAYLLLPYVAPTDDGARFRVHIRNAYGRLSCSAPAESPWAETVLRVLPDDTPPTVEWVAGDESLRQIRVQFSEPMLVPAATNLANFDLGGALRLLSATRLADGKTVVLETSEQTAAAGYPLTLANLTDLAGNPLPNGTRLPVPAFTDFPGLALCEVWKSTWLGTSIDTLLQLPRFKTDQPSYRQLLDRLETPTDIMDRYGQRISGQIVAPSTGAYVFAIAADDTCRLFLDRRGGPSGELDLIAFHDGWTSPREWTKYPSQRSTPVPLVAGQAYRFQALMVEDGGGDNLAVGWIRPGSDAIEVIEGAHLLLRADPRHLRPTIVDQPRSLSRFHGTTALLSV
ncbi:MAG: PA14 domain-containing protein, partial [Nitrospira sp.]|nr:PA14 domain-containing protein [Nitrospira sp.]